MILPERWTGKARNNSAAPTTLIMDKKEFIKQLRSTAEVSQPLTDSIISGSFKWNGVEYAKVECAKEDEKGPNPYALAWWSRLNTIADLIGAQSGPLSDAQIAYLNSILFGGMGSLTDLSFDSREVGHIAGTINGQLKVQTSLLYACFGGK
jgi:hypothetical protein